MVNGKFVENIPLIPVTLAWGDAVQTLFLVLDTGFTGDIQLSQKLAAELGLSVVGVTKARLADGRITDMPKALALATMEGVLNYVDVQISESFPLAGIGFLSKFSYQLKIDCKYRTITLARAE